VTRQVDQLARHIRRLGNHALNELLLQLPQPTFAALVEHALTRPVLPAGLVLRFEPAPGVDGWTVVACAPRRRLGILTRDQDPSGRLGYRAWTRAAAPARLPASSAGDVGRMRPQPWPGSPRRVGLAAWPWPTMSVAWPIPSCTSCCGGCPVRCSTGCWRPPTGPRGRPHDRPQALSALRPGQASQRVPPSPMRSAPVLLLPVLPAGRHPSGPQPAAPGPSGRRGAAGGRAGPAAPPPRAGPPGG
jgi:hypothetical protein